MRAIKFRIWDKALNEMLHAGSPGTEQLVVRLSGDVTDGATTPDVVLMQFTGLHDRDGKEIYESDYLIDGAEDELTAGFVYFDKGAFWIELKGIRANKRTGDTKDIGRSFGKYLVTSRLGYGVRVAGNLYENPELLEPRKEDLQNRVAQTFQKVLPKHGLSDCLQKDGEK